MQIKLFVSTFFLILFFNGFSQTDERPWLNEELSFEERATILVDAMTLDEKLSQFLNTSPAIVRLDVPEYDWWNEALHGVARNGKATIFPQGIGVGASFDPDLAERIASAISTEARAKYKIAQAMGNKGKYAGLTFWTPNVNIFRDPRWGRGQETYGEDPYLMSKIGVAFVNGLQGDDDKYLKSAACAKHFAVHSGPEKLRHTFNVNPSQKDLYETYLPAFEALVTEARVEGVMGAYNAVFDEPACASEFLLKDLLKDEWNFDGYIVSDCGALGDIYKGHKKAESPEEAAALALKAGVNLNCGWVYNNLKKALDKGLINEDLIDERLAQLYKTRFRLGFFDAEDSNPYNAYKPEVIHCEEHIALAREAAQKSIVLLKNKNNILPLAKDIKVPYVTGPFANSADMLMGSYYGISPNLVTILEGVADAVSLGTSLNYRSGALPFQKNINPKNWAPHVAAESDVTICVVGITADMEGEEVDAIASASVGDRIDLKLPQNQIDYVKQIIEFKKGPLVLVIASGSPVSLEGIEEHCDAVLQIWYPGEQGGNAVADVLFGNISPSGKLPLTFPKNIEQVPAYEDYSMKGRTYKYMTEEPLFPFGFGLSYSKTTFNAIESSRSKMKENDQLTIHTMVENIGNFNIEEVVQLYIKPSVENEDLPRYKLIGFQRVSLEKGAKEKIEFQVDSNQLKFINNKGESVWLKGDYEFIVGNSLPSKQSIQLGASLPVKTSIKFK